MTSPRRILPCLALALVALALGTPVAQGIPASGGATAPGGGSTSTTTTTSTTSTSTTSTSTTTSTTTRSATKPRTTAPTKPALRKKPPTKTAPTKTAPKRPGLTFTQNLRAPIITTANCYRVRATVCGKNPRTVQITGELVFRGRFLRPGELVFFPRAGASAAHVKLLGAPLRPTNHGIVVTVPAGATSGRIWIAASPEGELEALRPDQDPASAGPAAPQGEWRR